MRWDMVSRVIPVDPFDLVIFGGTGDLARRKILPGLYRRFWAGQMPEGARVIGASRKAMTHKAFRDFVAEAIAEFGTDGVKDKDKIADSSSMCTMSPSTPWARTAGATCAS